MTNGKKSTALGSGVLCLVCHTCNIGLVSASQSNSQGSVRFGKYGIRSPFRHGLGHNPCAVGAMSEQHLKEKWIPGFGIKSVLRYWLKNKQLVIVPVFKMFLFHCIVLLNTVAFSVAEQHHSIIIIAAKIFLGGCTARNLQQLALFSWVPDLNLLSRDR